MTKAQIKAEIDRRTKREMTTNYGWKCSPRKTRRMVKEQVERELAAGNLVFRDEAGNPVAILDTSNL
ncbi:MAG: hypothetical protein GHHEDOFH_01566 [Pseudorhodoplanes sp.]|nr:hypothetical protein [Pseudorhodoplanes sp.]